MANAALVIFIICKVITSSNDKNNSENQSFCLIYNQNVEHKKSTEIWPKIADF